MNLRLRSEKRIFNCQDWCEEELESSKKRFLTWFLMNSIIRQRASGPLLRRPNEETFKDPFKRWSNKSNSRAQWGVRVELEPDEWGAWVSRLGLLSVTHFIWAAPLSLHNEMRNEFFSKKSHTWRSPSSRILESLGHLLFMRLRLKLTSERRSLDRSSWRRLQGSSDSNKKRREKKVAAMKSMMQQEVMNFYHLSIH